MNKKKTQKNGRESGAGRPQFNLDWNLIAKLCEIQCTKDEIASVLGVTGQTIYNRCKSEHNRTFDEYWTDHQGQGRVSLRRAQMDMALGREGKPLRDDNGKILRDDKGKIQWEIIPIEPNPTLQVWLGKQYLGQKDKSELSGEGGKPLSTPSFVFVMPDGSKYTAKELASGSSRKD